MPTRLPTRGRLVTPGRVMLAVIGVLTLALAAGLARAATQAPKSTALPEITGTASEGQVMSVTTGAWDGTTPLALTYAWQRCDAAGTSCAAIGGATSQVYYPVSADVGGTLRVTVTAANSAGSASATSAASIKVAPAGVGVPVVTTAPAITGTAATNSVLTASTGTWTSASPLTYAFEWQRCDPSGNTCSPIPNATQSTYTPVSADAGATLRVVVTAFAGSRSASAPSSVTAKIVSQPPNVVVLPDGRKSVSANDLSLPDRLLIVRTSFSPARLSSRKPFTARVAVQDTAGFLVRDAAVEILGVPYSRVAVVPEKATGTDGTVTFTVHPLPGLELGRGKYLVFFVRARSTKDPINGGISARRLVQLRTGPPA